jgi:hypothetical protein
MSIVFGLLYREFCRARLAEMRKQLLLWPGPSAVPEENCEAGHPDDAADMGKGLGSPQEWSSHAEKSQS